MGFCSPIIYCLLKGIRVNIPKLIIDYIASEHLLIPNWHLPFGMLITCLLKQLKFDLSAERSIEPSVDINNTLLKKMRAREHAPAPQSPPIIPDVVPGSSCNTPYPGYVPRYVSQNFSTILFNFLPVCVHGL